MKDMVKIRHLVLLTMLSTACGSPTAPPAPTGGPLTGTWISPAIPSGAYTLISLQTGEGRVTGSGGDWGLMSVKEGSFTVAGSYSEADSSFAFSFSYSTGATGSFVGHWSASALVGTWKAAGRPTWYSAIFSRARQADP